MSMTTPITFTPGRDLTSGADGTYIIVQNGYSRGRRHQWGSELWRNGVQAMDRGVKAGGKLRGDEEVVFDFVGLDFVDGNNQPLRSTVWKRRIWNDAPPMNAIELMEYFSELAKGAGANRFSLTNLAGQYGQGSRFSVLGHSDMFVATTQPGGGTQALLIYDTGLDKYSLTNFEFPDRGVSGELADLADMTEYCYLTLGGDRFLDLIEADLIHPKVIQNGGVTTILMGRDMMDHYVDGDANRGETSRGLVTDLTQWLNSPHPVTVTEIRPKSKGGARVSKQVRIHGTIQYFDEHLLKSYDDWFARVPVGNRATVQLANPVGGVTDADVYLLPEDWNWKPLTLAEKARVKNKSRLIERNGKWFEIIPDKDTWFPYDGMGFVVYGYDHEMIPVYDTGGRAQWLKNWGVNAHEVAARTAIVIRPPKLQAVSTTAAWGVQQTGDRGTLLGPNSSALPLDDWTNEFFDLLQTSPDLDFLRKALAEAAPPVTRTVNVDDLKRIQEEMAGRLALAPMEVLVKSRNKKGTPATEDDDDLDVGSGKGGGGGGGGGGGSGPKKRRRRVTADPNGAVLGVKVKVDMMPDVIFLDEQEWQDKLDAGEVDYTPNFFCVVETGGAGTTVFLNRGHEIYVGQCIHYTSPKGHFKDSLPKLKRFAKGDIEGVIEEAYGTLAVALVFFAVHMTKKNKGGMDWNELKRLTEPEKMTLALGSYVNVNDTIRNRLSRMKP